MFADSKFGHTLDFTLRRETQSLKTTWPAKNKTQQKSNLVYCHLTHHHSSFVCRWERKERMHSNLMWELPSPATGGLLDHRVLGDNQGSFDNKCKNASLCSPHQSTIPPMAEADCMPVLTVCFCYPRVAKDISYCRFKSENISTCSRSDKL